MNQAHEEEDDELASKMMTLFEHLAELRTVIMRSFIVVLVFFCIAMAFSSEIIGFLKIPLAAALPEGQGSLHFTGPLDVFIASLKVSFLTSVIFSCPFWLFQFWSFLAPGLYPRERRLIIPFALTSIILFISGISFCFFLILPMALNYLIGMGLEVGIPIITVNDYLSLLIVMMFAFGLVFETPVLIVLMALLDLLDASSLRKYRAIVLVSILVTGAVLTPPDPISQVSLAVPVYLMYEISIIVVSIIKRPKKDETTATVKA